MSETNYELLVADSRGKEESQQAGIMSPDASMIILTWITFALLLAILYRFAWKPILQALDDREARIRKSLDDARKASEELAQIQGQREKIINEADHQARDIVESSKKAAVEAAKAIERKAKDEASVLMGNAESEIEALQKKAQMSMRKESVDLAVQLAEKLIHEKLDVAHQQKLIDRLIEDFDPETHEKS